MAARPAGDSLGASDVSFFVEDWLAALPSCARWVFCAAAALRARRFDCAEENVVAVTAAAIMAKIKNATTRSRLFARSSFRVNVRVVEVFRELFFLICFTCS